MNKVIIFTFLVFFFITGCSMAPKYTKPQAPIPKQWPEGDAYKNVKKQEGELPTELKWQEFINDKRLQKIIEMALKNNRDLRLAALNVERARAYYNIQRAELLPALDVAAAGSRQRVPYDLSSKKVSGVVEQYSVNLGLLSWEIDFFGRIKSLTDRALEEYLATKEAHQSAKITIIASCASAYLTYAADKENLSNAYATLKAQQQIYDLIKKRYEVGLASELDLYRAQTQVDAAKQEVSTYTQLVAQNENVLNLIVGEALDKGLLPEGLKDVVPPKDISPGLSSEILLRRPDIMAAEHYLKAVNAMIGAARAAFFPRISLTTTMGTASSELSRLFRSGQETWNFSPQITMPVFDTRVWAAYKATKVEREYALAQYEKTIQTAFKEVADTLAVKGTVDEQLSAQNSLVDAMEKAYQLASARYTKGLDSYLGVLDAQRSLINAQKQLVALKLAKLTNHVRLYAVLGGGSD